MSISSFSVFSIASSTSFNLAFAFSIHNSYPSGASVTAFILSQILIKNLLLLNTGMFSSSVPSVITN